MEKQFPEIPESPGNSFKFLQTPRNRKNPFPDSPNPRGMKISGELAFLLTWYIPLLPLEYHMKL